MTRSRFALLVAVCSVGIAACGGGGAPSANPGARIVDLARDAGAGVSPVDPNRGEVLPVGTLRLTLEELLGVHGALTTQMMREAATGGPALQSWMDALAANTAELSAAIGLVYGPDGARAFDQLWSFHTQFFLSYAESVRDHDGAEQADARAGLQDYTADFASFLATATGGTAPETAVVELLRTHIGHLTDQLDAYADGDLARSLEIESEGHAYLATIGTTLAGAIAAQQPTAFPGRIDDEPVAYCSLLASRLTALANVTATAAVTGEVAPEDRAPEWSRALTLVERDALDDIGEGLGTDLRGVTDVFAQDQTSQLGAALLAAIDRPTLELQADSHDFASFGPQLLADQASGTAAPLAIRDAYATAYRLANAVREP